MTNVDKEHTEQPTPNEVFYSRLQTVFDSLRPDPNNPNQRYVIPEAGQVGGGAKVLTMTHTQSATMDMFLIRNMHGYSSMVTKKDGFISASFPDLQIKLTQGVMHKVEVNTLDATKIDPSTREILTDLTVSYVEDVAQSPSKGTAITHPFGHTTY